MNRSLGKQASADPSQEIGFVVCLCRACVRLKKKTQIYPGPIFEIPTNNKVLKNPIPGPLRTNSQIQIQAPQRTHGSARETLDVGQLAVFFQGSYLLPRWPLTLRAAPLKDERLPPLPFSKRNQYHVCLH